MAMPNMTGDLLVQALISINPTIPVIVCTGFSERMSQDNWQIMDGLDVHRR
jgi:FixJ family two-component response regulator